MKIKILDAQELNQKIETSRRDIRAIKKSTKLVYLVRKIKRLNDEIDRLSVDELHRIIEEKIKDEFRRRYNEMYEMNYKLSERVDKLEEDE